MKVGVIDLTLLEGGASQVGEGEVGLPRIATPKGDISQVRLNQLALAKSGVGQHSFGELSPHEGGTVEVALTHSNVSEIAPIEHRISSIDLCEGHLVEAGFCGIDALPRRMTQMRSSEVRTGEIAVAKVDFP